METLAVKSFSHRSGWQSHNRKPSRPRWQSCLSGSTSIILHGGAGICSQLRRYELDGKATARGMLVQPRGGYGGRRSYIVRSRLRADQFSGSESFDEFGDAGSYQRQHLSGYSESQMVASRAKAEYVYQLWDHMMETCNLRAQVGHADLALSGHPTNRYLDNVPTGSILYCIVIRRSNSEPWTPVYLGQSGIGRQRMLEYMWEGRYFAARDISRKRLAMMEILIKGLDIGVQFIEVDDAIREACEKKLLKTFDFAFNSRLNHQFRGIPLHISHLPDNNPGLRQRIEADRQELARKLSTRSRKRRINRRQRSSSGRQGMQVQPVRQHRAAGHFTAFLASNKPEPVESKDRAVHRPPPAVEAADSRPQDPDDEIVMTICDGQSYFTPTSTVELVNAKPVVVAAKDAGGRTHPAINTRMTLRVHGLVNISSQEDPVSTQQQQPVQIAVGRSQYPDEGIVMASHNGHVTFIQNTKVELQKSLPVPVAQDDALDSAHPQVITYLTIEVEGLVIIQSKEESVLTAPQQQQQPTQQLPEQQQQPTQQQQAQMSISPWDM